MTQIVRVFPRRTAMTPTDGLAFVGEPPTLFGGLPGVREIHVSCVFSWDRRRAQWLARQWSTAYPEAVVRLGGPAFEAAPGDFQPGRYLREGVTITSRGCIRRCPYCIVPHVEGPLAELPIRPGWEVQDNNLLACSMGHVDRVLDMLAAQPKPARLVGGLDARLLTPRFAGRLRNVRVEVAFTAYDDPAQWPAVDVAIGRLRNLAGLRRRQVKVYCMVGFPGDTPDEAIRRCEEVIDAGATPFAQFFQPLGIATRRKPAGAWAPVVRCYSREAIMYAAAEPAGEGLLND